MFVFLIYQLIFSNYFFALNFYRAFFFKQHFTQKIYTKQKKIKAVKSGCKKL